VTTTSRAGLNTTIYINRGKRNGVAKGMKGKMCGKHRFTIVRALPFRSKAIVQSSVEEIGQCSSVIIYR
jgi:cell shape-determining protein MreC